MPWQIIGHDWAVALLRQSLAADRVAHAYLFAGPPQVGKTTLALALARALNCTQPDPPCGQCPPCQKITKGIHPDVRLVVGEGAGASIKIEQIRALQREAALAPYEGRRRIVILRNADGATEEAANSLLKILEEPPGHLVLILTAVQVEALPTTVASRCQRLDLRPVAQHVVESALCATGMEQSRARLLATLSQGQVGWALDASRGESVLQQRQKDLDDLVGLLATDRVGRLEYAAKSSQDPQILRRRLEVWSSWWRDLLLLCSGSQDGLVNVDRLDELNSVAEQLTISRALAGLQAMLETAVHLEARVNTRLALESLLLQFPRCQSLS